MRSVTIYQDGERLIFKCGDWKGLSPLEVVNKVLASLDCEPVASNVVKFDNRRGRANMTWIDGAPNDAQYLMSATVNTY